MEPLDIKPILSERRGLASQIARQCNVTPGAVAQWRHVPPRRVRIISELIGIPPHILQPEFFPAPANENGDK